VEYRTEKDPLGEIKVPRDAYYGIHTVRAADNFPVSGIGTHPALIRAMAQGKQASATANMKAGLLEKNIGEAIVKSACEIAGGSLASQFILDAFQGGAGTEGEITVSLIR
jgi:aspartate ammonia-lyase